MTEPDDELSELIEDELFAAAFETQRELNRVRLEMETGEEDAERTD